MNNVKKMLFRIHCGTWIREYNENRSNEYHFGIGIELFWFMGKLCARFKEPPRTHTDGFWYNLTISFRNGCLLVSFSVIYLLCAWVVCAKRPHHSHRLNRCFRFTYAMWMSLSYISLMPVTIRCVCNKTTFFFRFFASLRTISFTFIFMTIES